MPFPLAKLVALGLRQASKHLATHVKNKAKTSETFRKNLIKAAGWYHTIQTKARLDILGMGKVKNVKPLTEQAAIDLSTEIIYDLVLFSSMVAIYILFEFRPGKSKGGDDTDELEHEIEVLQQKLLMQNAKLERHEAKISRLERILVSHAERERIADKIRNVRSPDNTLINRTYTIGKDNEQIIIEDTIQ